MATEQIHDIQLAYRKLLHSMACPGVITDISPYLSKEKRDLPCYEASFLIAQMFLDTEVSFHTVSKRAETISKLMVEHTYATAKSLHEADFIFFLHDAHHTDLKKAIREAKVGNLTNPHWSATIIIEVDKITNKEMLQLTGPGIKDVQHVSIEMEGHWMTERARKNKEYPLGIDIIFIDPHARLICLPRTTTVREMG